MKDIRGTFLVGWDARNESSQNHSDLAVVDTSYCHGFSDAIGETFRVDSSGIREDRSDRPFLD